MPLGPTQGMQGKIIIDIEARTAKFTKDMGAAQKVIYDYAGRVVKVLKPIEEATKKATKATTEYSKSSKEMRLVSAGVQRGLGIVRNQLLLIYFAFRLALKGTIQNLTKFAEYEKLLMDIGVMISSQIIPILNAFDRQIFKLSETFAISAVDLSKAMFDIYSATTDTSKSMDILNASAMLAKTGSGALTDVTKGLVTIMESYGGELRDASDAADLLFVSQRRARATMGELTGVAGRFLPLASSLGISVEDIMAIFTLLTVKLGDVNEAATSTSAILTALLKPTKELKGASQDWYNESIYLVTAEGKLFDLLWRMRDISPGLLAQFFRRQQAIKGIAAVLGDLNKLQSIHLDLIKRSTKAQEAASKQMKTTQHDLDSMKTAWHRLNIAVGEFIAKGTPLPDFMVLLGKAFDIMSRAERKAIKDTGDYRKKFFEDTELWAAETTEEEKKQFRAREKAAKLETQRRLEIEEEFRGKWREIEEASAKYQLAELEKFYILGQEMFVGNEERLLELKTYYEEEKGLIENKAKKKTQRSLDDIEKAAEATYKAMADSMSDLFFDVITREFKTFEDYLKDFGKATLRIITDLIAKMMIYKSLMWFAGGKLPFPMHTGGMVSSSMRRFDFGGVAGNEVNARLLTGEGVLDRQGMRTLAALNRGEAPEAMGRGDTYVIINAIDTESFRERLARHGDIYEASAAGALSRNADLRRKIKNLI